MATDALADFVNNGGSSVNNESKQRVVKHRNQKIINIKMNRLYLIFLFLKKSTGVLIIVAKFKSYLWEPIPPGTWSY